MPDRQRTSRGPRLWAIPIVLLAIWAAVPGAPAESPAADAPPPRTRLHADPREMTRAFIEALDALLAEDPLRAKRALDRMAAASPPAMPEAKKQLGEAVVGADVAFHKLLDLTREVAHQGDTSLALRYHQGLQRTCLDCHGYARKDGVFKTSSRGDSGSPTPPNESKPSR